MVNRTTSHLDFENAAVRLVGCMHPSAARLIPNRTRLGQGMASGDTVVICELCGSATRDDGRTWKSPVLVQTLAEATNALSVERACEPRVLPVGCSVCGAAGRTHACDEEACEPTTGTEGA